MTMSSQVRRVHFWWATAFVALTGLLVFLTAGLFNGSFRSFVPVTLTSDRSGLVMESGGKVKMRGIEVGRVATISSASQSVSLRLDLFPDQVAHIPANVEAQINASTAFGAKYVELIYPSNPSAQPISKGAVLRSRNVSIEVNTVFDNLVGLLHQIEPTKLNAVLSALADGIRGKGEEIGQAITDANQVLLALNARRTTIGEDWRSLKAFGDTYSAAASDIIDVLDAASVTSTTVTSHAKSLDALLLNVIGLSRAGIALIGPNKDNLIQSINVLEPTTNLLMKYNPTYTCLILGAKWILDNGAYDFGGGNGRTAVVDAGILLGDDPYRYPDNLPVIGAKGGPGGKPGCGSLPDASKNYPVRYLVTNTGWGTGLDVRPNPGIGHPWWINFFPVTRAVPEPPSVRGSGPPAIGPVPYPGAPPYGAPHRPTDTAAMDPGLPILPAEQVPSAVPPG